MDELSRVKISLRTRLSSLGSSLANETTQLHRSVRRKLKGEYSSLTSTSGQAQEPRYAVTKRAL